MTYEKNYGSLTNTEAKDDANTTLIRESPEGRPASECRIASNKNEPYAGKARHGCDEKHSLFPIKLY